MDIAQTLLACTVNNYTVYLANICYLSALACTLTEKMFMLLYRNGLLIEHNLVEVNGQNVVGLKVSKIIHKLKEKPCYLINANKNSYC